MDPKEAFANYLSSLNDAYEASDALENWLGKGGFAPTIYYMIYGEEEDVGECKVHSIHELCIRIRIGDEFVSLEPRFDSDGLSFYDEDQDRVFLLSADRDDLEW